MRVNRAALAAACCAALACTEKSPAPLAPAESRRPASAPSAADAVPGGVVFAEDFESGSLSAFQDGVNPAKHRVVSDPTLAHSGTRALEMTFPANQTGGWLTRFFMPGYDSLYVRYWLRFEPAWQGGTKLLDLRGSRIDNQWSAFGKAGVCPNGSDYFSASVTTGTWGNPLDMSFYAYYPAMSREPNGTCFGRYQGTGTTTYASNRRITTGVWHKIEYWVKLNSIGRSDAVLRMWLDGQLTGEWTGFALRMDNVLRLNSLMLDGSGGSSQTQRLYIDDVQAFTAMPATQPPSTSPVTAVAVSLPSSSLNVGQSVQAVATARDASGNVLSGRTITWSSANSSVATVSATGLVTATGAGNTIISATSENVSGTAAVSVNAPPPPAPVASVTVALTSTSIVVGEKVQANATLRSADGTVLTGRTVSWSTSNASIATVTTSGTVTATAAGTVTIAATSEGKTGGAVLTISGVPSEPPPSGATEPLYNPAANRQAFFDDFERYSNVSALRSAGWALTTGADALLEFTAGSGTNGSRGLGFHFPAGTGWLGAEHVVSGQAARVSYISWDYRAPDFEYVGPNPSQQGIKHLLINNGTANRITIGLNRAMDIGMVQSNGVYLWVQPSRTPWGSQLATIQRLTDGGWHRFTVKRTMESSSGAMDGAIELWLDGEKLFDLQRIGTGRMSIQEFMLAGTFNGGSPKDQREWYDNVRVWY